MKSKISIIIPCYNSECYIGRCLESVMAQTYNNLEIIVVNDGSTDSSRDIVAEKMKLDKRIICIDQTNIGEFGARNTGLLSASGDYIGFIDSDDYVASEMYEKLLLKILESDSDMAVCNFNLVYDTEKEVCYSYANMPSGILNVQNDVYSYWTKVCASSPPNNYVWSRLYKRSKIIESGALFEKYPHSADTLFNFKLLPHLEKVVFVNEGLYYYYQRSGSGIHTIANKQNIAVLYADTFQALLDYYCENNFSAYYQVLPMHAYSRFRSAFFYSKLAGKSDEEIFSLIFQNWKDRDIFKYFTGVE